MPRRTRPTTSRAETAEETRKRLLEAGLALLREGGAPPPAAALRISTIVQRAEKTTGAFYFHWENREAYVQDLLAFAVDAEQYDEDFAAIRAAIEASPATPEAIRAAAAADVEALAVNEAWPLFMSAVVAAAAGHRSLDPQLLKESYDGVDATTTEVYGELLAKLGRRLRPPFDERTFGVILQSLAEGTTLRAILDPDLRAIGGGDPAWGLYELGVLALVAGATVPEGDDEPHDLREHL